MVQVTGQQLARLDFHLGTCLSLPYKLLREIDVVFFSSPVKQRCYGLIAH